ncbi:MAG: response regulator [Deltaproteobacteria bacterium]|nr:response regulator [Deltaproteobacteria bacterium]MBW2255032.1 response regulator [Deltaproteobacteria bacterium]
MEDRVLVVDDEEQFVVAFSKRLGARGFAVDTAGSGEEALQIMRQRRFDAVVLDLAMPGMDGIETLKHMLGIDPDAQVLLLTGHGSVHAATEAMKGGAADFLEKPADFADLLEKIRACIATRLKLGLQKSEEEIAEILRKRGW